MTNYMNKMLRGKKRWRIRRTEVYAKDRSSAGTKKVTN